MKFKLGDKVRINAPGSYFHKKCGIIKLLYEKSLQGFDCSVMVDYYEKRTSTAFKFSELTLYKKYYTPLGKVLYKDET